MPGKPSPATADIYPYDATPQTKYDAIKMALQNSQRMSFSDPPIYKINSRDISRYPHFPPPLVADWPESPSDDDKSEILVHEGFENVIEPPPLTKARARMMEENGLPPTPPTMSNSDGADALQDQRITPSPALANGVSSAADTAIPASSITPVNAISPPTPDPSPPAVLESLPAMVQSGKTSFLQPSLPDAVALNALRDAASSRAESFRTAREDPALSTHPSTSQVQLPEDDALPSHWLDSNHDLEEADRNLGVVMVEETPKLPDAQHELDYAQKRHKRRSKHESPPHTMEGHGDDWEKHISYVSGPDELDGYGDDTPRQDKPMVNGLGLIGAGIQEEVEKSAEDVNNMVYKRIREENVKRHSAVSANSGAIPVGVVVPPSDPTPRMLKRQTKCSSLRGDNASEGTPGSIDGDLRPLTYKKVRLPERQRKLDESPVFESSIRQVSSPARLGPDASNMTALTFASLQDSPSARQNAKFAPERKHTLRHLNHGDRLSNNFSIRRTSLHGSPASPTRWLEDQQHADPPINSPPITPPKRAPNDKIVHNIGVKRYSSEGARPSRVLNKPSNPVRGVIPSITSEPEETSPSGGRLRRFSRDERLENNDHVRRTSLGSSRDFVPELDMATLRPWSSERQAPSEKSTIPTSPRKSLDVRNLHPTTTPMSMTQVSDRTEVEVCEASGVRIYPHNNDSLLVVQHGSRPVSKDKNTPDSGAVEEQLRGLGQPIFAAQVDPPTPILGSSNPATNIDSPLTNPRAAPEPPVIKFIPPTPNEELERQLDAEQNGTLRAEVNLPQRRLSLLQRARRYSDSLFVRTGSLRKSRRPEADERDVHLSPLWRPQGFWDDFDSDDEYYDDFEPIGSLPKGGDTSDVPDEQPGRRRFPRAMSKRLPGFRGTGGFLVGNSLGIDRHGTNNRRHYVSTRDRTLGRRESQELMKNISLPPLDLSSASAAAPQDPRMSQESFRRFNGKRTFVVPFSGGRRAQWVGTKRLRERVARRRAEKEEKEAERRRAILRRSIGGRVFQG
jgi:hypothetical protein